MEENLRGCDRLLAWNIVTLFVWGRWGKTNHNFRHWLLLCSYRAYWILHGYYI